MISPRLLCAIWFGSVAVQAHAEETSDAMVLYKAICIASKGDLMKAEQLTIENGFSIDSDDHGRKTFDRTYTGTLSAPFVTLKPSGSNGNESSLDICEIFGTTAHMADFEGYAHSQSLVEVPKDEVFGDLADQNYIRIYASKECRADLANSTGCIVIETIGDKPTGDSFSGVLRFGVPRTQSGTRL
ncbi:hypothetical protein [Mesorhizobium silamurunense]|uniref:hypothetical protein n=1 Tax=Mesorhizobium silamurunense TaxID=499528 RepID=UPI001786F955|nr:hypothetical protein [Mesorhizobium silamurunense]